MIEPYVGASTVTSVRRAKQRAKATAAALTFSDTYVCWEVNRDAGWADSTSVEAKAVVESGTGSLSENGAGGPVSGEQVIHVESPYRLHTYAFDPATLVASQIDTGNLLVINGTRLFRVDAAKRERADDLLMNVYVTELFNTPMPEVP